jgi:hypothetical protein
MYKKHLLVFGVLLIVSLALTGVLYAGDLGVGVRGLGGFAGGSTDSSAKDGKLGYSVGAEVNLNYYFFDVGRIRIGASSGVQYVFLSYESVTEIPLPATDLTAKTSYSYLVLPLTVRGAYRLNSRITLTADTGGFLGFFLSGTSDNTYDPEFPPNLENGKEDLNKDNTERLDIGLRFAAGLEMEISDKLLFTPGILFDLGLTDTSKDVLMSPVPSSKDTFWKLSAFAGIIYQLF